MRYLLLTLITCCAAVFAQAQVNLNSGLVAYYPFNGNTNDASGNGNNAVNNGATLTTDQAGNPNSAYYFDGTSNFMQVANSPSLNPQNAITLCARVYPTGYYQGLCYNNAIITKNITDFVTGNYSLRFTATTTTSCYVPDTNFENFRIDLAAGCSMPTINTTPYIQKNTWYCIIGVFDGSNLKMYVNGVLRYQCNTGATTIGTNTNDVFIGKMNNVQYPYWFKGKLDEIRLYNRALNQQEIDSLCNYVSTPVAPDTIINKYGAVLSRQGCDNIIGVDTATGFNVGDTILMIQMKGAVIDSTNTASFGSVTDYRGAGNYEYNVIKAKNGNNLTLKYKIVRDYNIPDGKVQIVRVPYYQNYTVNQPHTCMPWNGSKGGVFVVNVANTLTLNSNIDVSGKGFTGGQPLLSTLVSCNRTDYFYPSTNNYGGQKGEGIASISAAKMYGRGALANGGGGGGDHNAGGGGGSNAATGGLGGNQYNWGGCGAPIIPVIGGIGGYALSYSSTQNKIFLGGGGGAGHGNNLGEKPGAEGGGIVIINTNTITGNAKSIIANGANATECYSAYAGCQDDGTGGGGGGGTVLIKANTYSSTLNVNAQGGKGANTWVSLQNGTSQVAPGGGGGGGIVWYTQSTAPAATTNTSTGGTNGILPQFSNSAWGAQPGQAGQTLTGLQLNFPVDTFKPNQISVNFSDSVVSCYTRKFKNLTTNTTTGAASWNWTFPNGSSAQQNPTYTFPGYGIFPVTLVVTDSNGCKDSITRNITISYVHFAKAGNDTTTCYGGTVTLHASGGVSYAWSPATGLSNPTAATTTATPAVATSYIVTVTNAVGCIDKDTVNVSLVQGVFITAVPDQASACEGKTVNLNAAGGVSYTWSPAAGLDNPNIANPVATVHGNQQYIVTGKAANGCTGSDTVAITEVPGPVVSITSDGGSISCYNRSVQLYAHGALSYNWQPAQYCNDNTIPSPTVTPPVTTVFTVTGTDASGCPGTDTITIFSYKDVAVYIPNAFTPNNDGLNDVIKPMIFCDFEFEQFAVFDRWGENVFTSYTLANGWDGTYKGAPAPLGVYHYFVKGRKSDGTPAMLKGNFTLIR